jgi:uncharacterized protein (DUF2062 family)
MSTALMPRKLFKKMMPAREHFDNNRSIKILGDWIFNENLWHLNRNSSAAAVFIGIFVAFLPIPGQMFAAALLALIFAANLPLAIALVWITNPITIVPIFYGAYELGSFLLGQKNTLQFSPSIESFAANISVIWKPLILGSLTCGFFFGSLGYSLTRISWRIMVVRKWQRRLKTKNQAS